MYTIMLSFIPMAVQLFVSEIPLTKRYLKRDDLLKMYQLFLHERV